MVALKDREIVGVVRFRMIGQYRLLTGMAVEAQSRQQGIGKQLLDYCQKQWLNPATFCFAYTHLEHFYQQGHFIQIAPHALPAELHLLFERYSRSGKDLIPMQYQAK
ncbi:TPA: GNAT family N-acetyltransferase [Vibrio cholerae]